MQTEKLYLGLDIGNGYIKLKGDIGKDNITADFPSNISGISVYDKRAMVSKPSKSENVYDTLEASFQTPIVSNSETLYVIGNRSLKSGRTVESFNINANVKKTSQELSFILILTSTAGTVLKHVLNEVSRKGINLPNTIFTEVDVSLSLPISDYEDGKKIYYEKLINGEHTINFHQFDKPCKVILKFTKIDIIPEGFGAYIALQKSDKELMQKIVYVNKELGNLPPNVTAEDILNCKNVICIDIGEGTTNIAVSTDGKFNQDASQTLNIGHGTALENTLNTLKSDGYLYKNRQDISDLMQKGKTALNRKNYEHIEKILNYNRDIISNKINAHTSQIIDRMSGRIDIIFVYGGGAEAFKEKLYPKLLKNSKTENHTNYYVIYLDSNYSRFLNRTALHIIATQHKPKEILKK